MGVMIAVIIAGGSGTRLWPLSTPDYPKHLLTIDGSNLSLLQQTYKRAQRLTNDIYVVSEIGHIEHVKAQLHELPEASFIVEPGRRGTANCIVAALAEIGKHHDADEPIAFLHADHYVRDTAGFVHSFKVANDIARTAQRIVLVGIEPDYPATGFGYIEKGEILNEEAFVFNVQSFKEKPEHEIAKKYLNSGNYLWNAGYFVGSLTTFLHSMQQFASELKANYDQLITATGEAYESIYLGFENAAIDYALIEKVQDLLVVPASFDWMDLGSFRDLADAAGGDVQGNHVYGEGVEVEEVENSFIHNHEEKPLVVIGLDNVVVVNTPNGILVTRKDVSQKVGDVSKRLNSN